MVKKIVGSIVESEKMTFYTSDVLRILDIKTERLRQWIKLGYIEPSVRAAGSGRKNVFSKYSLFNIALFKKLIDFGLNRWISARYANHFDYTDWNQVIKGTHRYMIISGEMDRTEHWQDSMRLWVAKKFPNDLKGLEFAFIIDIYKIMKNVERKIK